MISLILYLLQVNEYVIVDKKGREANNVLKIIIMEKKLITFRLSVPFINDLFQFNIYFFYNVTHRSLSHARFHQNEIKNSFKI